MLITAQDVVGFTLTPPHPGQCWSLANDQVTSKHCFGGRKFVVLVI